ncbi:MAG: hypothetical protein ACR2HH_01040 [Chthoniobacterales bacterium]
MDEFNYLSVLLSIILGLAIAEILTGFRGLLQARGRVRLYWPSLLWSFILLAIYAQTWWAMFGLRTHHAWTFAGFAIVLVHLILLYMLASLVLPPLEEGAAVIDLRANYFAQRRWFCALLLFTVGVSLAKDLVIDGAFTDRTNLAFHLLFAALGLFGWISRREWYHKALAVMVAALFALYTGLLFAQLR